MDTRFRPNLRQYGEASIVQKIWRRIRKGSCSVRNALLGIIALPIGTLWMVVFIPFAKGKIWWSL